MPIDFGMLLRSGGQGDLGNAWQEGIAMRQAGEDRQRKIEADRRALADQAAYRASMGDILRRGDYNAASAQAALYGDDKAATNYRETAKLGYERADASTTAMANMAVSIANQPYENRRSVIQAMKPRLVAMGYSAQEIDAFDPTDANLAAIMGVNYEQKDRVSAANDAFKNETDRITATNPVVVGGSLVTRGGEELYRSPDFITVGTDQNLYETGGVSSSGFTTTISSDDAFDRMIGIESNGKQFGKDGRPLTSSAGAIGIAQVMPGTAPIAAKLAGLPYDENRYRNDPAYNRALGKAYFEEQVRKYGGDIAKASAAYNAGPGRVDKAIQRAAQRGGDWYDYLPAETKKYVTGVVGQRQTSRPIRQVQQGVPKPIKASGAQDTGGRDQMARDAYDRAISTAQRLLKHPGYGAAVGSGFDPQSWGSWNPISGNPMAGTNAQDFIAELDALKAQVFLPMVQSLRGMGALSDAEGKKLTDAIGALNPNMSEEAFRASVQRIIADLQGYRARPITGASVTMPPAGAIAALQANPSLAPQFDGKYGAGAAAMVLGR